MKKTEDITIRRAVTVLVVAVGIVLFPKMLSAQQSDSTCAPRPLPWAEAFEGEGYLIPPCWTMMADWYGYPYISRSGYATSGTSSMALAAGGGSEICMLATPLLAHRADSLHVGFWLTMNDGYGLLQVGLVSDTSDTASFTAFITLELDGTPLGYYEFYTDGYSVADTEAVAFRLTNGRVTVDDIEVEAATLCRRPWLPFIGTVTHTSISFSWSDPGSGATGYLVRRINTLTLDTTYLTVYATEALLSGLTPATPYQLDVAALCGGDTTGWMSAGVVTTDVACRQPLNAEIEATTANAAVLSWRHDMDSYQPPTAMLVELYDMTATAPFGNALNLTGNYAFLEGLATGHRYRATLQALCSTDTSMPITLVFTPLAAPCSEVSGTAASSASVVNGAVRHSYSQMLYPKSLFAGADSLYGIALRVAENSMYFPRRLSVYVGQTADSVLTSNVVAPLMTHVIDSFSLAAGVEGWLAMPFDSPIAVDTARNLVVAVLDNTGNPTGVLSFGVHSESYGGSLYTSSQTLPIDPSMFDMPMYSIRNVADLQLYGNCATGSCLPPAAVVTAATDSSFTLQWAGGGDSSVIVCQADGDQNAIETAVVGSGSTVAGLATSTRYTLRVGTICGADTAFGPEIVTTTACGTVAIPYVADFTAGAHPCWQGIQNETVGGVMVVGMLLSPEVSVAASALQMRLSLHPVDPDAVIRVGVAAADGTQIVWVDSVVAADIVDDEWVAYLDNYTGTERHLIFDGGSACLLMAAFIEPLDDCLPPRRLAVSAIGADCATLSWQSDAALCEIHLREVDGNTWSSWEASAGQFTFTGLAPQTSYIGYAVSHCSSTADPSARAWFRFTTGCGIIAYFPYTMGFEPSENTLDCWMVAYADPACATANPVVTTTNRRYSGQRSLRFSSYNNIQSGIYDQYLISPRIQADDSIYFSFRCYKEYYDSEPFQVGFSVSGNSAIDFLWMGEVEPQAGQWMQYEIGLPASTKYVAIKYTGRGNYYLYIDELTILGPGCAAPQITMLDEQASSVAVSWQADADTVIAAITDGLWLSNAVGTAIVGNTYIFSDLQPGRYYTVGLRTRCSDGRLSDWTTRRVSTIDPDCMAPTSLSIDTVGFTIVGLSWQPASVGQPCQLILYSDGEIIWQSGRMVEPASLITGLAANHTYSVAVRAYCSDIPGPWSEPLLFTTQECLPVSDVEYERIDYRTINLTWTPAPVTTGRCRIEYGLEGFSRGSGIVIESATPCRIAGLDPYGNYDFYIQNYCESGVGSDSVVHLYIPTGVGIQLVDGINLTLSPNPASRNVVVGGLYPSAQVVVCDATGRCIGLWTAVDSQLILDVSSYASGTYFVRVISDCGTAVGKLIVR